MFKYSYRRKPSLAPLLRRDEIERIALGMLSDYKPELLSNPQEVDIEDFTQNYLMAHHDYQFLSNNGVYLGMTIFDASDKVVVYNPKTEQAEYISEEANTIIIDKGLLGKAEEHRYRFTVGHEAGHVALPHAGFFRKQAYDTSKEQTAVACRELGTFSFTEKGPETWTDEEWIEWQADVFASALLMPEPMVRKVAGNVMEHDAGIFGEASTKIHTVHTVQRIFNVSKAAAENRLRRLGLY